MVADRFALAVRIGSDQDVLGILRLLLQVCEQFSLASHRYELRLVAVVHIDGQSLLGQIHHVTHRSLDDVIVTEELAEPLRLLGRLDDDQVLGFLGARH